MPKSREQVIMERALQDAVRERLARERAIMLRAAGDALRERLAKLSEEAHRERPAAEADMMSMTAALKDLVTGLSELVQQLAKHPPAASPRKLTIAHSDGTESVVTQE